ncbi:hypothetical protein Nepgr_006929 [Nepenthes gracilis]|uniref:Glutaredoxin domain-containing protein n=1 Tax=Nepenthes gracilis TaxID=150966 RepID=A0AAD3S641_NEPGR|nr:hypothetical protein Nepgr_006929 [Nepenthes gracilis]
MSRVDENCEFSTDPKRSSVLNRAVTIHSSAYQFPKKPYAYSSPALDRISSVKKWYNPFESAGNSIKGKVRQLRIFFESPRVPISLPDPSSQSQSSPLSNKFKHAKSFGAESILDASTIRLPGTEDRIVVYFTSLRGVRRTYEDCYAVRMILKGYKVYVDERDLSMDSAYKKELQNVLGEKSSVSLPQVFIKGRFVGGADVIKHLNEIGELRKLLEGLPLRERGTVCNTCGDVRFVPCSNCNGSRKVFDEDEEIMKRCSECNENGLVRCPECCL